MKEVTIEVNGYKADLYKRGSNWYVGSCSTMRFTPLSIGFKQESVMYSEFLFKIRQELSHLERCHNETN